MDAVPLSENERLHLRIPTTGLVTEVDSSLQELFEAYVRHTTFSFWGADYAPIKMPAACTRRVLLTLRELEALTSFRPARFLSLDLTCISRKHPLPTQNRAHITVVLDEGTRKTEPHRIGLSSESATMNTHGNVELTL